MAKIGQMPKRKSVGRKNIHNIDLSGFKKPDRSNGRFGSFYKKEFPIFGQGP